MIAAAAAFRAIRISLYAMVALAAAALIMGRMASGTRSPLPQNFASAVKAWKGGELQTCAMTVDGAALEEFTHRYNVVMMCGIGRPEADRFADRAITVSRSFTIAPKDLVIEEAVSGPMRVLLDTMARRNPVPKPSEPGRLHEEALWYELVLLPKDIDPFAVRTLNDVVRFGGKSLLPEPRWSVISLWVS